LPVPKEGGSIDELWKYAPVDKKYRDLIIVFILDVLKADTEYCLLEIVGEQGSAKSFLQDLIKQLTDPKVTNLGRPPSGERNFFVAAANSHLISIENVSSITQNDSDNYCTVITGGGTVERKLYSNSEEAATNVRRPIVINGINSVVDREDLRDRTMLIQMSRIEAYKSKSKLMADFNERKAYIFHDMLKLMSEALQLLPEVEDSIDASELPRLADLGCFGEAVYRALEEKPGKFLEHFRMVQIDGIYSTLESSTVAVAAKRYVEEEKSFEGLVGELREKLEDYAEDINSFPKTSHAFGRELRRCVPALRKVGINIVVGSRNRYGFPVTLRVT
ncbi:hypothetical protein, partial [Oleiphilus sp. HI0079]|uniref:hypothetical protein n=2 Tax=Oleiphilus sp. HI0079 TaxID=1822254 RepID=UPI0018D2B4DE